MTTPSAAKIPKSVRSVFGYAYVIATYPSIAAKLIWTITGFSLALSVVLVLSVVTILPTLPALLVGALVQGVLHGWSSLDSEELTPTFWWGAGVAHVGLVSIIFYLVITGGRPANIFSSAQCRAIRSKKLSGPKRSFTRRQRHLDVWLSKQEAKARQYDAEIAELLAKKQEEDRQAVERAKSQDKQRLGHWDDEDEEESEAGSSRSLPAPRDAEHFEEVCAMFLRRIGHNGVRRTPTGPDGGIDVISNEAVGQAKFHPSQKVSAEPIRALAGSRLEHGKQEAYFFHYGPGYTDDAINVGCKLDVKLYEFDAQRRVFRRRA